MIGGGHARGDGRRGRRTMIAKPTSSHARWLLRAAVLVAAVALTACGIGSESADDAQAQAALTKDITEAIGRYAQAANTADEAAARALWAFPDQISYVNPMARLKSMAELQGFWQFLRTTYTARDLKPSNIMVQGKADSAWATFDWEFTATGADGKVSTTRGWETQVYQKTDRGWRLRHVHYSAALPPPQ